MNNHRNRFLFLLLVLLLSSCSANSNGLHISVESNPRTAHEGSELETIEPFLTPTNSEASSNTLIAGILSDVVFDNDMKKVAYFGGQYSHLDPISVSSNDCYIWSLEYEYINYQRGIVKTDWLGNKISSTKWLQPSNLTLIDSRFGEKINISPNGNWLSYSADEFPDLTDMSYSKTNLYLVSLNTPQSYDAILISKNGGASLFGASWALDESFFVFTDFDDNKIQQIYSYNVLTNTKTQITQFDLFMKNQIVYDIELSLDSKKIAFTTDDYVVVWELEQKDLFKYKKENGKFIFSDIFWNKDSNKILLKSRIEIVGDSGDHDELIWIDLKNRQTEVVSQGKINADFIVPLDNDFSIIGTWSTGEIGIYYKNLDKWDSRDRFELRFSDYMDLIVPREGPVDLSKCKE